MRCACIRRLVHGLVVLGRLGLAVCGFLLFGLLRQLNGLGQVHEAHRDAALQPVAQRLPLGRVLGEGVECGALRLLGNIEQHGDWRPHALVEQQRQDGLGIGRPLYEHHVRSQRLQRGAQAAGAARAVVTDAEDVRAHVRSPRGKPDTDLSSHLVP
jgi:hypothetical protein